jgi:hypothetical protein
MNMKKTLLIVAMAVLTLGGCATNEYAMYAEANAKMAIARSNAEAEKYKAMSAIAASGTEAAKVAAVMAIALGGQSNAGGQQTMSAPQASQALQWAQVLVPGFTQVAGIAANMRVATVQSNNATALGISTNESFVGIAGKIQAPGTITTNTMSGTGVLGTGTYTTTDSHAVDSHAVDNHAVDSHLVNPTPVVIVPGTTTPVVPVVPVTPAAQVGGAPTVTVGP